MKQGELPKTEMHTILHSGKLFIMALLNYLTVFQNIKIIWMKHYILYSDKVLKATLIYRLSMVSSLFYSNILSLHCI